MKYIIGGRMGDLIHQLYVIRNTPGRHDLYITDRRELHSDGFIHSLEITTEEIRKILIYQDYVESVQAYYDDDEVLTDPIWVFGKAGNYINLNMWRRKAYSDNWTVLLSKMFNVPISAGPWLRWPVGVRHNKIVHCSIPAPRRGNWDGVNLHGGVFMGSLQEYQNFNRLELPHIVPHSLEQMVSLIASCGSFIGNQSLPLAIAHALNVPRIGVLNEVDCKGYMGEELIFEKFKYVL